MMQCSQCKNAPATVQIKIFRDGEFQQVDVCESCSKKIEMDAMGSILPMLMLPFMAGETTKKELTDIMARATTKQVEEGENCEECYEIFRTYLIPMLKAIHKTYHADRDKRKAEVEHKEQDIQIRMRRAIIAEDFETAAKLRDELKTYRASLKNPETPPS